MKNTVNPRSLRFRVTLIFVAVTVVLFGSVLAANTWFLEGYYRNYKVQVLKDAYEEINAVVQNAVEREQNSAGSGGKDQAAEMESLPEPGDGVTLITGDDARGPFEKKPLNQLPDDDRTVKMPERSGNHRNPTTAEDEQDAAGTADEQKTAGAAEEQKTAGTSERQATAGATQQQAADGRTDEQATAGAAQQQADDGRTDEQTTAGTEEQERPEDPDDDFSIATDPTVAETVRRLRDTSGISIVIYDSLRNETLLTSTADARKLRDRVQRYIIGQYPKDLDVLYEEDNYKIQTAFDTFSKTKSLESWGFFTDNGTVFIMAIPLDSIRESSVISNRFLLRVGLIVIIVGSILIYLITRRITEPLADLSKLSERMSKLDFTAKYQDRKNAAAEVTTLGKNMNVLSDRLSRTIEELKGANEQLQKDIEEKEKIDELRKEFIANVSHELKTPIALIQGYAEGLVEGMAEDPENRDYYCGVIMDEANKMNKMVRQLLTLTALEFGRERSEFHNFDLNDVVRGVIGANQIRLKEKNLKVDFEAEGTEMVCADEFQIEQVITNYLNNAVNHVEGERVISIRTEEDAERGIVRTTVYNSGKNIPQEELGKLWQKFYKVDKARTRAYGGSGIGLSIVKAIMDAHHQAYGVSNTEDGVEFWFELKMAEIDTFCGTR